MHYKNILQSCDSESAINKNQQLFSLFSTFAHMIYIKCKTEKNANEIRREKKNCIWINKALKHLWYEK